MKIEPLFADLVGRGQPAVGAQDAVRLDRPGRETEVAVGLHRFLVQPVDHQHVDPAVGALGRHHADAIGRDTERLVAGLATPEGKVKTVRGDTLVREPDWQAADGGRTVSARLLQPALMEFANGGRKYDNTADKHSNGKSGLSAKESERILESLTGKGYDTIDVSGKKIQQKKLDAAFDKIEKAVGRGRRVPCSLFWTEQGHEVLVSKVRNDRVYYINPWGKEESLSVSEFKSRLTSVNLLAS